MGKANDIKLRGSKEQLVFINECLPQLVAGKYTVTADLDVVNSKSLDKVEKDFWVDAPRFILPSSDIYSIYPPKDATGRFETTLPHIVLNRRTLPWERTIDGKTPETTDFRDAKGHAPWMALILLSEDEMNSASSPADKIALTNIPLKDTFKTKPAGVFVPEINAVGGAKPALTAWEDMNVACPVIDIPLTLFKTVVPRKADLPFIGHVRQVMVDDNKEKADIDDSGFFSTIVCNRLPRRDANAREGKKNTAFLVSLEGFHNYLRDPNYIKDKKVRLVVLTSWSFTVAEGKNFMELCQGLRVDTLKMNSPGVSPELKGAYDYGYTLLPHLTRNGAKTFSWYRGPLNPNFLPLKPNAKVYTNADEALRFDRQTGLFDVSYAAAWQLGRLLALKDKSFSTALYQWKMTEKRNVLKKAAKANISALLPSSFRPSETTDRNSLEELVKDFLGQNYSAPGKAGMQGIQFSTHANDVRAQLEQIPASDETENPPPPEVKEWLAKLFLLQGVPLNYLIPHEHYLIDKSKSSPVKEALGTFYIDYGWMEALLGGALSIVSHKDSGALLDMLRHGKFLPKNITDNRSTEEEIPTDPDDVIPKPEPGRISDHITGFVLRSELVSGWKGIKIFPKGAKEGWLTPLRLERISDDIKLCIFSGKVQEIYLIQPPEGIHFGIEGGTNSKKLRTADGKVTQNSAEVTFHDHGNGVIDIANTAAAMQRVQASSLGGAYSSADFAFQMLEGPIMFVLKITD